jgi:hypothetical protein
MDAFLVKQGYLEGEADTALLGKIASSEKK